MAGLVLSVLLITGVVGHLAFRINLNALTNLVYGAGSTLNRDTAIPEGYGTIKDNKANSLFKQ